MRARYCVAVAALATARPESPFGLRLLEVAAPSNRIDEKMAYEPLDG